MLMLSLLNRKSKVSAWFETVKPLVSRDMFMLNLKTKNLSKKHYDSMEPKLRVVSVSESILLNKKGIVTVAAEVDVVAEVDVTVADAVVIVAVTVETTVVDIGVMTAENLILGEAAMDETDTMIDAADTAKIDSKAIIETDLQQKDHLEKNQGNQTTRHLLVAAEEDFN